jgi:uncharacterized protein with HEPN domain
MATSAPRLTDILDAIDHIRAEMAGETIEAFEVDQRWLVERGVEIVSKASRRLPEDLKLRRPEILWQGSWVGNVLRHEYESISAPVTWKLYRMI